MLYHDHTALNIISQLCVSVEVKCVISQPVDILPR